MKKKECTHHGYRIGRRVFGVAQTAVGAGVMTIGLSMLILPGPGAFLVSGGAVIACGGAKKVFGR